MDAKIQATEKSPFLKYYKQFAYGLFSLILMLTWWKGAHSHSNCPNITGGTANSLPTR